jgi:hypothetical protein
LPPEKKKVAALVFSFFWISMFSGLRNKFMGRMTKSAAVVVKMAVKDGAAEAPLAG